MGLFSNPPWFPKILLGLLTLLWICLGVWICFSAPFASGTDESIRYVAFAAAKNRWATEADFKRFGIDNYYYPPLYFLLFAPFYRDEPSFTDAFDWGGLGDPNYDENGGLYIVSRDPRSPIPAELTDLYRSAKLFSLACGVVILACLSVALALLFHGPARWWLVLAGTAPCLLLPQFLYYQTLCNNDALVNALSALAVLAFIGAWGAALERRHRRFAVLSLVSAACIGLGLLTKQSATCLIPLLPGLALLLSLDRGSPVLRSSLWRSLGFLCILCALTIACGGWWTILEVLQSDPTTVAAQQLTHPWAIQEAAEFDFRVVYATTLKLMRSYVALFTGDIFGIPDTIFLIYLAVPLVLAACLAIALIATRRRSCPSAAPDPRRKRFDRVLWFTLAATIILNLVLIGLYNLSIRAAYGRLLFPTLVACHVLLARGIAIGTGGRPRPAATVSLILTTYLSCLFLWVFSQRMVQAVTQPAERLVPIASYSQMRQSALTTPVWEVAISQQLRLPAGLLRGMRIKIFRSQIPQIGSALNARLRLLDSMGRDSASIAFEPSPIGDNDATSRWTDLRLSTPHMLSGVTRAVLDISASPPLFPPHLTDVWYGMVKAGSAPGLLPAALNGELCDVSLRLAAVYAFPGPGASTIAHLSPPRSFDPGHQRR